MVKGMDGFPRWRLPLLVADVPKCSSGQEESSQTDGNPMIGRDICIPWGSGSLMQLCWLPPTLCLACFVVREALGVWS